MVTFDFCALYYLNWWTSFDRRFVKAFSLNDKEKIINILPELASKYRISRNFKKEYDVELYLENLRRFEPVANIVSNWNNNEINDVNYIEVVSDVRAKLKDVYKKDLLSATTKILWIKVKSPIIIYDNNAVKALKKLSDQDNMGDYAKYTKCWKKYYENFSQAINFACQRLLSVKTYAKSANEDYFTEEYIREISNKQWFKERVLDIYFWHVGT